jgi:ABC-type antimicrobial peptide transport system permease subunit
VCLALVGLFAVLSFTITARTREFGIRMALGATPADLMRVVLNRGARELAWGLALGLLLAFAISQALTAAIEHVPPGGPVMLLTIAATVAAGATLALWSPLRRTLKLSAAEALRRARP